MDGHVTPCAIAYAAMQVRNNVLSFCPANTPQLHFALTDTNYWMHQYTGFDYEDFHEFIIDYFKANTTLQAQEVSTGLLKWWNKYISCLIFISTTINEEYFPGKSSGIWLCMQPHPLQGGKNRLPLCNGNARLTAHLTHPPSLSSL